MEYEGMRAELVASGMRAGKKGSTSIAGAAATGAGAGAGGAGAGADFFFLVAFFLDFFMEAAAATPMQQQHKAPRRTQAMIGMYDPAEPEWTEPKLA